MLFSKRDPAGEPPPAPRQWVTIRRRCPTCRSSCTASGFVQEGAATAVFSWECGWCRDSGLVLIHFPSPPKEQREAPPVFRCPDCGSPATLDGPVQEGSLVSWTCSSCGGSGFASIRKKSKPDEQSPAPPTKQKSRKGGPTEFHCPTCGRPATLHGAIQEGQLVRWECSSCGDSGFASIRRSAPPEEE